MASAAGAQLHAIEGGPGGYAEADEGVPGAALDPEDADAALGAQMGDEAVPGKPPPLGLDDTLDEAAGGERDGATDALGGARTGWRALDIAAGGVFSVILGNRSTHARYFLPSEREATQLLHALTLTPQSVQAAAETRELLAMKAAVATAVAAAATSSAASTLLPNALERKTLITISERVAKSWRVVPRTQPSAHAPLVPPTSLPTSDLIPTYSISV